MPMTMTQMKQRIDAMNAQIVEASNALATAALDNSVSMEEVTRQQTTLTDMTNRVSALQAAFNLQCGEAAGELPSASTNQQERGLRDILLSNEYARSFAYAVKNGITPKRGIGNEQCNILYNALTISGGNPEGEDGGFLVPEDVDHSIMEQRRALNPLSNLFTVEMVSTSKGWRVMDNAPTKGMTALDGEIPTGGIPQDDQPQFSKIPYSLTTYGLILPISNELAGDEVANLFAYLSRWFARKQIITENTLLKTQLESLTAIPLTTGASPDVVAQLKSVLNKTLDPAISVSASILTNQTGFDYLDQLLDGMGRPLLQPDPTSGTPMLLKTRPVHMMSDKLLPNTGDTAPIYVGDFTQYATLFMRQHLEILSTDIGGNAFRTNSIEVRGIARMTTALFDKAAAVRRTLTVA